MTPRATSRCSAARSRLKKIANDRSHNLAANGPRIESVKDIVFTVGSRAAFDDGGQVTSTLLLTELELDALTELVNIGVSRA